MEDGKVIVKKSPAEAVQEEAMNILVSGVLHREDRTFVRVSFLRGRDWAEGILPDGVIEKAEGFTEEEIGKLEEYLAFANRFCGISVTRHGAIASYPKLDEM